MNKDLWIKMNKDIWNRLNDKEKKTYIRIKKWRIKNKPALKSIFDSVNEIKKGKSRNVVSERR